MIVPITILQKVSDHNVYRYFIIHLWLTSGITVLPVILEASLVLLIFQVVELVVVVVELVLLNAC